MATAVGVHPNFAGVIALEIRNLGEVPVRLFPGDPIAQLFFHSTVSPSELQGQGSQFRGAAGPVSGSHRDATTARVIRQLGAKMLADRDADVPDL